MVRLCARIFSVSGCSKSAFLPILLFKGRNNIGVNNKIVALQK